MNDATPSANGNLPAVCVVTQPARRTTGKTHVHQLLDVLGASTSASLLTANLAADASVRDDHEVIEFAGRGTGKSLPVSAYRFLRNQMLMARALDRRPEGVVLFFGATAYLLPMLIAKLVGKSVVVVPRGDVPLSLRLKWEEKVPDPVARVLAASVSLLERIGFSLADAIVTYTPRMASQLDLERYGQKLHTNGARYVDTERFRPRTPFEERGTVVGYLGRLDVEKRVTDLVEIAKRLPPNVTFLFVGDGDDREFVERALTDEIKDGHVEMTGRVEHDAVPEQLNRMQLLLLTSEPTEGLPTVILEAFACGTPVYAPPVSGVSDVVRDWETGILMTDDDPSSVTETIESAIGGDALAEMSQRCRSLAVTEFGFEAAVERWRAILEATVD